VAKVTEIESSYVVHFPRPDGEPAYAGLLLSYLGDVDGDDLWPATLDAMIEDFKDFVRIVLPPDEAEAALAVTDTDKDVAEIKDMMAKDELPGGDWD
jgi:hypothetical protein